jgi:hypothetical protein
MAKSGLTYACCASLTGDLPAYRRRAENACGVGHPDLPEPGVRRWQRTVDIPDDLL